MITIAIVGRPNVGKSTLFNRLCRTRKALVSDIPGLTRDRREGTAQLGRMSVRLIDTAGLEKAETETLEAEMMRQTEKAVEQSDLLFLVIDGRAGLTPQDRHFAEWIRREKNKTCLVLVNKCENPKAMPGLADAYALGFGDPIPISAEHGTGIDAVAEALRIVLKQQEISTQEPEEIDTEKPDVPQIAIIGKPNVGKSTFYNQLAGEDRTIVSDVAGTTRDAIYTDILHQGKKVQLVDTAGLRKRARRQETPEKLSADDTYRAIQYAHVVILLIDATAPLEHMDLAIAGHVAEEGRGLVIAVNKWDLVEEKEELLRAIRARLEHSIGRWKEVALIPISAKRGTRVGKVLSEALAVFERWNKRVPTSQLNRWFEGALSRHTPPLSGGRRVRLRYITQAKSRPPTFYLFTSSNTSSLPDSYLRYLSHALSERFGFAGVPLRMRLRKSNNPFE